MQLHAGSAREAPLARDRRRVRRARAMFECARLGVGARSCGDTGRIFGQENISVAYVAGTFRLASGRVVLDDADLRARRSAGLRHHLLWLRGRQARRPPRRRRPWSSDAPCSQRGYDPTIHEPADMSASCRPVGIVVRHREPDRDTILGVTRPSAVPVSPRRWHGRCL